MALDYNSSHVEPLLIMNLSLHFFWFPNWYPVSSFLLPSSTRGFLATSETSWSKLSTKAQFSQLLNTRAMNLKEPLTNPSSNSLSCVPLHSQSLDVAVVPSTWFPYVDSMRTRVTENMSRDHYAASPLARWCLPSKSLDIDLQRKHVT